MSRKLYIAWNEAKNEGYVTDTYEDAYTAQTGKRHPKSDTFGVSTVAISFFEINEGEKIEIEEIDL